MGRYAFSPPAALITPGLFEYRFWNRIDQMPLAERGWVAVLLPYADAVEVSPSTDRIATLSYNNRQSKTGGEIRAYRISTSETVRVFAVAPDDRATLDADAVHAWIASNQGIIRRLDLLSGEFDKRIEITGGNGLYWTVVEPVRSTAGAIVAAAGYGVTTLPARVYRNGVAMPDPGPPRNLLGIDDRGRALFEGNLACDTNAPSGFGACAQMMLSAGGWFHTVWKSWGLTGTAPGGAICDVNSGARWFDVAGAAYSAPTNRVLLAVGGTLHVADADTLQTLTEIAGFSGTLYGAMRVADGDVLAMPAGVGVLVARLGGLTPAPFVTAEAVRNAATGNQTSLSPGAIVSIFGEHLGPDPGAGPELVSRVRLATEVEHTQVMFDGLPGAILYTGAGQINVVVPDGIRSSGQILTQVYRYGLPSPKLLLNAAAAAPGLFAYSAAGRQYASAVDLGGRLQSPGAPLERGKVAIFYATGVGLPAGLAAEAVAARPTALATPPRVTIGGRGAEVLYAGAAPGLSAGVTQLNILIPADAPVGDAVEVAIAVGPAAQGGVWVAIR